MGQLLALIVTATLDEANLSALEPVICEHDPTSTQTLGQFKAGDAVAQFQGEVQLQIRLRLLCVKCAVKAGQ
jgi:hypothetical protein